MTTTTKTMTTDSEKTFDTHPAAGMFPLIDDDAFAALVADIREHGQREPVLVVDGQLVDGRNRLRACRELGIKPIVRELTSKEAGDPFALVMSLNFHRRHLREHQRGEILRAYLERRGWKPEEKHKGGRPAKGQKPAHPGQVSVVKVAKELGVPRATLQRHLQAAEDYKAAAPQLKAKVDVGEMTAKQARAGSESQGTTAAVADEAHGPEQSTGKRAQVRANAQFERASEFVARIEGVAHVCRKVRIAAIGRDPRLLQHWLEALRAANKATRRLLRLLENHYGKKPVAAADDVGGDTW